jgi:outer membrane protein with beta-barrel domain
MKVRFLAVFALLSLAAVPLSLFAQKAEISPYAGYIWPGSFGEGIGNFRGNQLLGVRGGYYVTSGFEIGGNYSWNNHFQPTNSNPGATMARELGFPQGSVRGNIWEAEFSYNFGKRQVVGHAVKPYVVGGAGGLTTSIKNADTFALNVRPSSLFFANDVLNSGDTFFTFSYGGGLKAMRLWGPMGFFGDFRGRTLPNFFGTSNTWPELSAGLNFSWGEK